MISVRRAAPDNAAALTDLATRTFTDTFATVNTPENMALFLSSNYSTELQRREILNPDIDTLLAYADGNLAGFAQVRVGSTVSCVTAPEQIELWRFYVAAEWLGRGVAQELMAVVVQAARRRGKTTLWLGVWEHNPRALAGGGGGEISAIRAARPA